MKRVSLSRRDGVGLGVSQEWTTHQQLLVAPRADKITHDDDLNLLPVAVSLDLLSSTITTTKKIIGVRTGTTATCHQVVSKATRLLRSPQQPDTHRTNAAADLVFLRFIKIVTSSM